MRNETLLVEDLLLLMLDDETGTPAGASTMHYSLGGAVLVELALQGRVETEPEERERLNGPKVLAAGDGPLDDPLLQAAWDKVAERTQRVQPLLLGLGGGLWSPLIDRLVDRGLIRREKKKVLGLFPVTRLPSDDQQHEQRIREDVRAALEDGVEPDVRTAAIIALLSSSGTLPMLRPPLAWSGPVQRRAKEFEQGSWGAGAVNTAVARNAAAVAAASAAASIAVVTTVTST